VTARPSRLLAAALGAASAWIAAATLLTVVDQHHALPWIDDWHVASEASAVEAGLLDWKLLAAQLNEHRLVVPRFVFYADYLWFDGTGALTQAVICGIQVLHVVLLCGLLRAAGAATGPWFWSAASLVLASMLWGPQVINLNWNIQLSEVVAFFLATGCLAALFGVRRAVDRGRPGGIVWLAVAIGGAVAATFSRANGMLVWISLLLAAWLLGLGAVRVSVILLAGGATVAAYFDGYRTPVSHNDPVAALPEVGEIVRYVAVYLGLPARAWGLGAAAVLGAAGALLAAVALSGLAIRRRLLDSGDIVMRTLLVFPLLTAAVTALGRIPWAPDWPNRYVTSAMYFWSVLAVAWTGAIGRRGNAGRALPVAALGVAAAAFAVLLAVQQGDGRGQQQRRFDDRRLAALSLQTGVYDDPVMQRVTLGSARRHHDVTGYLRRRRLSVFASPRFELIGSRLSERFDVRPGEPAAGEFAGWHHVPAPSAGVVVTGWLDAADMRGATMVALSDRDGRIVGIADVGLTHDDPGWRAPRGAGRIPWTGYARVLGLEDTTLRAHAVRESDGVERAIAGSQAPSLQSDPRTDSLGAQLLRLQEVGRLDLRGETLAAAGALAAYLGATLPVDRAPIAAGGAVERVEPILDEIPAVRVSGCVWDAQLDEPPVAVVVTDANQRILGVEQITAANVDESRPRRARFALTFVPVDLDEARWSVWAYSRDARTLSVPDPGGETTTAPFHVLGEEVEAVAHVDTGWVRGGTLADYAPPPHGAEVLDSWAGSDAVTGVLRIGAFVPGPRRELGLPILAGPVPSNLHVEIVDLDDGVAIARLPALAAYRGAWRVWRVRLPAGVAERRLAVVITDRGSGFGEWIAVSPPRWIDVAEPGMDTSSRPPAPR
jgi:hypothetical protein